MKEITGDLWDLHEQGKTICITTNGIVNAKGECVMGRGIALQAKQKYPMLPKMIGDRIKEFGNEAFAIRLYGGREIATFPVKHHWRDAADLKLITKSAVSMLNMADCHGWEEVYLPRPGCGNGRLQWSDVKPVLEAILDDRFTIVEIGRSK
jgi:hypothetical protein